MSVTLRNGRYVIPVRREARGDVGGIVHDSSGTGATLFVEPPAAVEFGNRIRELEAEELREIDRILRELTDRSASASRGDGRHARRAGGARLRSTARARFAGSSTAARWSSCTRTTGSRSVRGRHPLLLAQGVPVVPFDLAMAPEERTLLVSGPNTGGKTVLLKALGLIAALTQCAVPVPADDGSAVAVFDDFFADVGDEQSIQASLSTFSAHLKNLAEILEASTSASLVLIDELGSGTDPLEGAALGGAILEELTARRTTTVATTHLGALKELATEVPAVVNASLQFDSVALAPTYRLIKGVPGRSYGLSIARRLALPERVLARAEERVPKAERDVDALLADLERRAATLATQEEEVAAREADATQRAARLAERERNVRTRERDLEKQSRQEARQYVLQARQEIERTIRSLRRCGGDVARRGGARGASSRRGDGRQPERAAGAARPRGAQGQPAHRIPRRRTGRWPAAGGRRSRGRRHAGREAGPGDRTPRRHGNRRGRCGEAAGTAGHALTHQRTAAAEAVVLRGDQPEPYVPSEVDLRGMRVDEMDDVLMQALDAAVRADMKELRIIHGKGTGALRERVDEMLRKDTRVRSHRLGAWNEGGAGVTVAEFA